MSLISIRNLTAPIRSKVQLGALLIAALLVLVIRLGGSSGAPAASKQQGYGGADSEEEAVRRAQIADLLNDNPNVPPPKAPAGKQGKQARDDVLDGLVDGRFDRKLKEQNEQVPKNESFEDIRRSLGLE